MEIFILAVLLAFGAGVLLRPVPAVAGAFGTLSLSMFFISAVLQLVPESAETMRCFGYISSEVCVTEVLVPKTLSLTAQFFMGLTVFGFGYVLSLLWKSEPVPERKNP